jgi:poly-gamma-glutamate synthesis protein (capsule biosynthesis protein)
LAECEFRANAVAAIRLHPLDLGHGRSRAQRGRPVLARGEVARRTLERVARLSKPFGTRLEFDGETATIRLE